MAVRARYTVDFDDPDEQTLARQNRRERMQLLRGGVTAQEARQTYQPPMLQEASAQQSVEHGERRRTDWASRLRAAQRAARLGSTVARMTGQRGLAEGLAQAGGAAGNAEGLPGFAHTFGSNTGGRYAQKMAERLGAAGGRAAALGGAVAGVLEGENVEGVARNSLRWWLRKIAFGAIFALEPISGSIAVTYLNLDFLHSEFFNVDPLAKFFLWEKLLLIIVDILILLLLLLVFVGLYYLVHPCEMIKVLDVPVVSDIAKFFQSIAKLFGKSC